MGSSGRLNEGGLRTQRGAQGQSQEVTARVLARRTRDSVGGSRGGGTRLCQACLSGNRTVAATGGALPESRVAGARTGLQAASHSRSAKT